MVQIGKKKKQLIEGISTMTCPDFSWAYWRMNPELRCIQQTKKKENNHLRFYIVGTLTMEKNEFYQNTFSSFVASLFFNFCN